MMKKLREVFMKNNCKRLIKKNLGLKKLLKRKVINYMSNGKDTIILLTVGLIRKTYYKRVNIFHHTEVTWQMLKSD